LITYQDERFADVIGEIKPLLEDHYEEIAVMKDKIKLNPNYQQYEVMEQNNMLHIATVRVDGKLAGYCISFIVKHIHYQDCVQALNDILFVAKEYRHGSIGTRLIKYAEQRLTEIGAQIIHYHVKISHDFGLLMEKLGYACTEKIYSKYIGG
jgi:GNAT superfamily N-acetyltransferase